MGNKQLANIARFSDNSKFLMYRLKTLMLPDIWQPHEVAKFKAATYLLKAKNSPDLSADDSRRIEAVAQELLDKPIEQFEQKIAEKGSGFELMYTSEDGDILLCGNAIIPFVTSPVARKL